jgi:NhaP-type Na+/H+ or K+/H+ antiporter
MIVSPWWGLIAAPFVIGVVYAVLWEWLVQRGRDWRDSLEDTVHVTSGAAVACALLSGDVPTAAGCLAAQGALLGIGVWRRT